jgi:hypothetical protein
VGHGDESALQETEGDKATLAIDNRLSSVDFL